MKSTVAEPITAGPTASVGIITTTVLPGVNFYAMPLSTPVCHDEISTRGPAKDFLVDRRLPRQIPILVDVISFSNGQSIIGDV